MAGRRPARSRARCFERCQRDSRCGNNSGISSREKTRRTRRRGFASYSRDRPSGRCTRYRRWTVCYPQTTRTRRRRRTRERSADPSRHPGARERCSPSFLAAARGARAAPSRRRRRHPRRARPRGVTPNLAARCAALRSVSFASRSTLLRTPTFANDPSVRSASVRSRCRLPRRIAAPTRTPPSRTSWRPPPRLARASPSPQTPPPRSPSSRTPSGLARGRRRVGTKTTTTRERRTLARNP